MDLGVETGLRPLGRGWVRISRRREPKKEGKKESSVVEGETPDPTPGVSFPDRRTV